MTYYTTTENSYATSTVSGGSQIGGLVGLHQVDSTIIDCYSTGMVEGTGENIGGLVGRNSDSIIFNSYWDIETSGEPNMCGSQDTGIGCEFDYGKTTAEMHQQAPSQTGISSTYGT